jgi:hypothetical protein
MAASSLVIFIGNHSTNLVVEKHDAGASRVKESRELVFILIVG